MTRRTVIVPRIKARAWHGDQAENPTLFEVAPLQEALQSPYDGEALITTYAPRDADQYPRLGKAAQAYFAATDDEDKPYIHVVPVDIDYGDHEVPPDGWHREVLDRVEWPCGWYRTPHGLRLVFLPNELVELEQANSYLSWLHGHLEDWGVETDEATRKWYRLFAAPHANRRDYPFDYSDLQPIDAKPTDLQVDSPTHSGPIIDRDRPTGSDLSVTKTYLQPLNDRQLKSDLYHERLSAPAGSRHATFLRAASKIVHDFDTDDPVVPWDLLYPSWTKLDGKEDDELWRICEWMTAQYSGQKRAQQQRRQNVQDRAAEVMDVPSHEVHQRVVIDTGSEQFVWDEDDESYSRGYTHQRQLIGALQRHAPNLASWALEERPGIDEILRRYSSVADRLVYSYGGQQGYDAQSSTLYESVCGRDKRLSPARHQDVERWVEALSGSRCDELKRWLAAFPRLDRPLCGLYLQGPPSIGKQLFALGLARLYSPESAVTPYSDVVGEWNSSLKESPLIWADEQVPQDAFRANDSSVLRRIIGNDSLRITEKHRSSRTLVGYPRVLITSNNDDALAIRESLDQDDIEAIQIRLGYISTGEEPIEVLKDVAASQGYDSTREATESWVAGGKLAEYILWLSEHYEWTPDNRLLVEGWPSPLTRDLPTRAGAAELVGVVTAKAILSDRDVQSVVVDGDTIYVDGNRLAQEWNSIVGAIQDDVPGHLEREKALEQLSKSTREDGYWAIPLDAVARICDKRTSVRAETVKTAAAETEESFEFSEIAGG